jgi:uncharacterized protein (DUF302 family)
MPRRNSLRRHTPCRHDGFEQENRFARQSSIENIAAWEEHMAIDGLMAVVSRYGYNDTVDRLNAAISALGMTVVARIDHAAAAANVGLELRPTEVLIFGNPKTGTPLMQTAQTIGIDLPLKILIWRDEDNKTWLGYNDPHWLAQRHGATANTAILEAMARALSTIAAKVASSPDE